jgi:AmiR/NasT family two-component response regulator
VRDSETPPDRKPGVLGGDTRQSEAEALRGRVEELSALVAGLHRAMETRGLIEQAKGILIATTGCSPGEAFEMLRLQSQDENRKVLEVARELVAQHQRSRL